jgi:hypothetical protein
MSTLSSRTTLLRLWEGVVRDLHLCYGKRTTRPRFPVSQTYCHPEWEEIFNFLNAGMTGQGNKIMGNIILAYFSMKVGVEK